MEPSGPTQGLPRRRGEGWCGGPEDKAYGFTTCWDRGAPMEWHANLANVGDGLGGGDLARSSPNLCDGASGCCSPLVGLLVLQASFLVARGWLPRDVLSAIAFSTHCLPIASFLSLPTLMPLIPPFPLHPCTPRPRLPAFPVVFVAQPIRAHSRVEPGEGHEFWLNGKPRASLRARVGRGEVLCVNKMGGGRS